MVGGFSVSFGQENTTFKGRRQPQPSVVKGLSRWHNGPPRSPCILITGDQRFKMAVDQEIVNDHITAPIVAQSYAFSLFYVCNIRYPKKMSLTLEFIQRVFLGIHPDRESKVQTKGPKQEHIPPRMLKLLTDLNNFANPWTI